jgi:hypothetical protein
MKKFTILIVAIAITAITASTAAAQCQFNAIERAKTMKQNFVRAQAPCIGSTQHPSSDIKTTGDTDACLGVESYENVSAGSSTPYQFRRQGGCKIKAKIDALSDCSTLTDSDGNSLGLSGACTDITFRGKCTQMVLADGVTPAHNITGFQLFTASRASMNDSFSGDLTVFDFPITFKFGTVKNGVMKLKAHTAERLQDSFVTPITESGLPTCTQVELLHLTILDPQGNVFARSGIGTVNEATEGGSSAEW